MVVGRDKQGGCLDKYATCGVGGASSSGILFSVLVRLGGGAWRELAWTPLHRLHVAVRLMT